MVYISTISDCIYVNALLDKFKDIYSYNANNSCFIDNSINIISLLAFFVAIVAVIVSVCLYYKQKNISLLRYRLEIIEVMDGITSELYLSGYTSKKYKKYYDDEIRVIFNNEIKELYKDIISSQEYCNKMFAGFLIAEKEGNWNVPDLNKFLDPHEIMKLITKNSDEIYKAYTTKKEYICKKFIKI